MNFNNEPTKPLALPILPPLTKYFNEGTIPKKVDLLLKFLLKSFACSISIFFLLIVSETIIAVSPNAIEAVSEFTTSTNFFFLLISFAAFTAESCVKLNFDEI